MKFFVPKKNFVIIMWMVAAVRWNKLKMVGAMDGVVVTESSVVKLWKVKDEGWKCIAGMVVLFHGLFVLYENVNVLKKQHVMLRSFLKICSLNALI